jgi:hypothetical protein
MGVGLKARTLDRGRSMNQAGGDCRPLLISICPFLNATIYQPTFALTSATTSFTAFSTSRMSTISDGECT